MKSEQSSCSVDDKDPKYESFLQKEFKQYNTNVNKIKLELNSEDEENFDETNVEIKEEIDIEHMKLEIQNYTCNNCEFETTFYSSFQGHVDECSKTQDQLCGDENNAESGTDVTFPIINSVQMKSSKVSSEAYIVASNVKNHTGKGIIDLFPCQICDRTYTVEVNLKNHMRLHTGKKLFKCKICGKAFITTYMLKVHMRSHTGEQPFQCQVCHKTFTIKSNLHVHMITHTGEKRFRCELCSKTYTTADSLRVHMRIHTGEKPYQCHICNKSFFCANARKAHVRKHTGEKPFQCQICGKDFTYASSLRKHMRKKFLCKERPNVFASADKLKAHAKEKPFPYKDLQVRMSHTDKNPSSSINTLSAENT